MLTPIDPRHTEKAAGIFAKLYHSTLNPGGLSAKTLAKRVAEAYTAWAASANTIHKRFLDAWRTANFKDKDPGVAESWHGMTPDQIWNARLGINAYWGDPNRGWAVKTALDKLKTRLDAVGSVKLPVIRANLKAALDSGSYFGVGNRNNQAVPVLCVDTPEMTAVCADDDPEPPEGAGYEDDEGNWVEWDGVIDPDITVPAGQFQIWPVSESRHENIQYLVAWVAGSSFNGGAPHPHIQESGHLCLGTATDFIEKAIKLADFEEIQQEIIENFLPFWSTHSCFWHPGEHADDHEASFVSTPTKPIKIPFGASNEPQGPQASPPNHRPAGLKALGILVQLDYSQVEL